MCNQDVFITRRVSEISKFRVRQILIYLTQRYISENLHNCRLSLLIPLPARCLHNFSLTNLTYKCCSLRRRRLFHFSFTPSQRTAYFITHSRLQPERDYVLHLSITFIAFSKSIMQQQWIWYLPNGTHFHNIYIHYVHSAAIISKNDKSVNFVEFQPFKL